MASLDELVVRQTQLMNSVGRSLTNFKKLGQAKMTEAVTRQRLSVLKETFQRCQDIDGQIHLLTDEQDRASLAYFKDNHFIACEDSYYEATDFMAEILSSTARFESNSGINQSMRQDSPHSSSHLPRISLPSFDGSYDKWESFRDKFKAIIHDDPSLSDVKRFHYLISCLKGDASNAIDDIDLTAANFSLAWNRLMSRYENKSKLVAFRLQALFNLPAAASESASNLRDLRDQTNKALHSLRNLGRPVEHWDDILVFLVTQKLDKATKKAWELKLGKSLEYPQYRELSEFLEARICGLDAAILVDTSKESARSTRNKAVSSHVATPMHNECPSCKANHALQHCPTFVNKTPAQRYELAKGYKRCINCLSNKHSAIKDCTSTRVCKQCSKKHHTLLHFTAETKHIDSETPTKAVCPAINTETEVASHLVSKSAAFKSNIMLATARVRLYSPQGRCITARALLDQGSVSTMISESLVQLLRLQKTKISVRISGIDNSQATVKHAVELELAPRAKSTPRYSTTALVVRTITRYSPVPTTVKQHWTHLLDLDLADPEPFSQEPIDLLIGADLIGRLIRDGIRRGSESEPIAQNTTLGWIVSGPTSSVATEVSSTLAVHHTTLEDPLESGLRRFWEIEEIPSRSHPHPEDTRCDDHFAATYRRAPDGRYIVRLPFKQEGLVPLGESRVAALTCLRRMEQKFSRDSSHAAEYREFMHEYEHLGHMTRVPSNDPNCNSIRYYIPHHSVIRNTSSTTKLRVVFNASCKTSNGLSLNDHLLAGPKLQNDLPTVILQWRQHHYVYIADIAKMYRQIWVDSRDVDFQRVLWRSTANDAVSEYQLRTVTYGTASAPYLALRVLKQLANDEGDSFPLARAVLRNNIYVDDFVFGAEDLITARQTRDQLLQLLNKAGFRLRKWASNRAELLADLDPDDHGLACDKSLQEDESLKVLGIAWNPRRDIFSFQVSIPSNPGQTKRQVLSTIAQLYDPLGWASPVIIAAKILMQRLWLLKCTWDEPLPRDIQEWWENYSSKLSVLATIQLPRWTSFSSMSAHCSLHGFSDASTRAYAACIYIRVANDDGSITTSLVMAKSRVAPIKTISVPRLELSAACLLANLMHYVRTSLALTTVEYHCWTDSTITLAWLDQPPCQWKTFVANRVSSIQTLVPRKLWHHVSTTDNPADYASRGTSADDLPNNQVWWHGPSWLTLPSNRWPDQRPPTNTDALSEKRSQKVVCAVAVHTGWDLAQRFSSWPRLLRVTAYIMRFVSVLRRRPHETHRANRDMVPSTLQPTEIAHAKLYWLRTLQAHVFENELQQLTQGRSVPKTSSLASLNPYLDDQGLIRVGGRLRHANIPTTRKHPVVVKGHYLLTLIIRHHHLMTMHSGSRLTLASLRQEYWPVRARETVRAVLHKCVTCTREAAKVATELMGDLPSARVNRMNRAFVHTGVDYAGPLLLKTSRGRGAKTVKGYLALIEC